MGRPTMTLLESCIDDLIYLHCPFCNAADERNMSLVSWWFEHRRDLAFRVIRVVRDAFECMSLVRRRIYFCFSLCLLLFELGNPIPEHLAVGVKLDLHRWLLIKIKIMIL